MSTVNEFQDLKRMLEETAKRTKERRRRNGFVGAVAGFFGTAAVAALVVALIWPSQARVPEPAPSATAQANSVSPTCAAGNLLLIGSTAFQPIAQAVADMYTAKCLSENINPDITVMGGDSAYGVTQFLTIHDPKTTVAMYDGVDRSANGYSTSAIGVLVFSVITHGRFHNNLNISTADLKGIVLGNGSQGVVAVGRRNGSGTRQSFFQTVLGQKNLKKLPDQYSLNCPPATGQSVAFEQCTADSTVGVLGFVNGTPNAIGYAAVLGPLVGFPAVSVINIDNFAPTVDNARSGKYGFWTVEHLYTDLRPAPLTSDFLEFLSSYIKSHPPQDFIPCPVRDSKGIPGSSC